MPRTAQRIFWMDGGNTTCILPSYDCRLCLTVGYSHVGYVVISNQKMVPKEIVR